ncbi:MAG: stage III sporulation protein AE [Clostridia bacterium]|nr:stage III sporulation protein AE [Clostridia bacterium]
MRRMTALIACLLLLIGSALAAESDITAEQSNALGLDKLTEAAEGYGPGEDLTAGVDLNQGLREILDTGTGAMMGVVRKAVRSGVLLLAIVLLCALADSAYCAAGGEGSAIQLVPIVGALAITAVAVTDVNTLLGMGREALERMNVFSKALLPTMAAVTAAGGAPAGAAARQLATMLFSDILMTVINSLLLPLVFAYLAASVAHAAIGNDGLKRIGSMLKWVVTGVLTTLLILFVGYLTVSGVIAGTADAVAVKAAKFTVSSMVPVVGGILSDAAETVLAGAGMLRNTVGVFGMLAILSMCLIPFLQLGVHYLAYKATAALSATVAEGRIAGLIDSIGGAFGLILGMTGASAMLLLVSMVSAVSMVAP